MYVEERKKREGGSTSRRVGSRRTERRQGRITEEVTTVTHTAEFIKESNI